MVAEVGVVFCKIALFAVVQLVQLDSGCTTLLELELLSRPSPEVILEDVDDMTVSGDPITAVPDIVFLEAEEETLGEITGII